MTDTTPDAIEPPRLVTFGRLTRRIPAYAIDVMILGAVLQAVFWSAHALTDYGSGNWTGSELWTVIFFGSSLPSILYFAWLESSARGASLGKRVFGLRVIDVDGQRISFPRAIVRTIAKFVPWEIVHYTICFPEPIDWAAQEGIRKGFVVSWIVSLAYLLTIAIRARREGPHDLVADTLVVIEDGAKSAGRA